MRNFLFAFGAVLTAALWLPVGQAVADGEPEAIGIQQSAADKYREAVAAIENKNYEKALGLLRGVLDEERGNANALNYMGYSYRKLGKYDLAISFYQQALRSDANHKGAHEYLGEAYLELNQPDKAKVHLDRLAQICGASCEEYRDLKEAWDAWQAKQKRS